MKVSYFETGRYQAPADSGLESVWRKFANCWSAYRSRFELTVAIDVAVQRCGAKRFSTSRHVRFFARAYSSLVRCKWSGILVMCIGNNHSPIMARRNRAESARTGRIWSRIVRRMVVVFRANVPGNRASFETRPRPERKFAGSLAVGAVHREPFSTVIPW